MPEDEFVHRHASIPFNGRFAGGRPPVVERDRLVVPVEVVRARAQPLLGVLRPVVIAAGDLNVLVRYAATGLPATRGGGRQRNVNGEREGSRGRSRFARHRQRSERSANFCRTSNRTRPGQCQPKSTWVKADRRNPLIPRSTKRFGDLYRGRASVEREFERLKHEYGLAPLRVRGLARVQLHADLTMLARLAQALSRVRAVPLAA
jgi:Transposase DDE domain